MRAQFFLQFRIPRYIRWANFVVIDGTVIKEIFRSLQLRTNKSDFVIRMQWQIRRGIVHRPRSGELPYRALLRSWKATLDSPSWTSENYLSGQYTETSWKINYSMSPDVTSPNFFVWGYLIQKVHKQEPTSRKNIIETIRNACAKI